MSPEKDRLTVADLLAFIADQGIRPTDEIWIHEGGLWMECPSGVTRLPHDRPSQSGTQLR